MAYKVEYGKNNYLVYEPVKVRPRKRKRVKKHNSRKPYWVLGIGIGIILLCIFTDVLIPGDATVTKQAVQEMVSSIRGGEQAVEAFAQFCQSVLSGG